MLLLSFRVLYRHFKALTDKVSWVEMLGAAIRGERVELFESVAQVMGNGVRPVRSTRDEVACPFQMCWCHQDSLRLIHKSEGFTVSFEFQSVVRWRAGWPYPRDLNPGSRKYTEVCMDTSPEKRKPHSFVFSTKIYRSWMWSGKPRFA